MVSVWVEKNVSKAPCMLLMNISLPINDRCTPSSNNEGSMSSKSGCYNNCVSIDAITIVSQ